MFQSTHPRRVRQRDGYYADRFHDVSIHAPTQGATQFGGVGARVWRVSIHAPTQGATAKIKAETNNIDVSIHAPTQGATLSSVDSTTNTRFNPRTHAGCD